MDRNDATVLSAGVDATSFWIPRHYMVSAWMEHASFTSWLVGALEPAIVVELGTHNGFSFFTMAETARRLSLPTHFYAIDSWEGDDHAGFYDDDVYESVLKIATDDYPDTTTLVRAYFSDAVDRFENGSVDLLHIDGRHGYEDVKEDFELYRPKLSDRAVVIFHDTHEFKEGFGVHQFWDEVATTAPSFTFHHAHGLGVLAVGARAPQAILDFLAAANGDPDLMRETYERLGIRVRHFSYIELLLEENAHLKGDLGHAQRLLSESQAETAHLTNSSSWRITALLRRAISAGRRSPN
jgi:hypothetical protein